jgi:hypothetical protein
LPLPLPKFCGDCGQETRLRAPTLLEFLQQLGGAYVSTEGALWRTLWRLLLQPGQLTLEYLAGRRKRYVLPLRLYLTISVLALLTLRVVSSGKMEANPQAFTPPPASAVASRTADEETGAAPEPLRNIQMGGLGGHQAGLRNGVFFCEKLPDSVCKRLERRLTLNPADMAKEAVQLSERALNNLGATLFVLLPCFALWLKMVFWDRRLRYTEHLVFALHLHAFWFAMLLLALAPFLPVGPLAATTGAASAIYALVALHRVYRTRWWSTALRAFVLLLLNVSSIALVLAAFALFTLAS